MQGKRVEIISCLAMLLFFGFFIYNEKNRNDRMAMAFNEVHSQVQSVYSFVTPEQKRRDFVITARDLIMQSNKKIALSPAYDMACACYDLAIGNRLDPVLLLALIRAESNFDSEAVSPAGAIGLCQIMPITARMLLDADRIEYRTQLLFNAETNIRLSCKYLNYIKAEIPNFNEQLAFYNGGPLQRFYYASKDKRLSPETREYVERINTAYAAFKKILG